MWVRLGLHKGCMKTDLGGNEGTASKGAWSYSEFKFLHPCNAAPRTLLGDLGPIETWKLSSHRKLVEVQAAILLLYLYVSVRYNAFVRRSIAFSKQVIAPKPKDADEVRPLRGEFAQ